MVEHVALCQALLHLDELQSHAGSDLREAGDAESPGQAQSHPWGDSNRGITTNTDLGEAHGTLLRFHVASAGVCLRQLQNIVGPILLGLTL